MLRKITKVKLTDVGKVDVSYVEFFEEGKSDEITRKCSAIAHQDLVDCFDNLRIHMATLCEQGAMTELEENPEKLEIFHTNQVSIGGDDQHEGVTVSGFRKLKESKILNLNAPFAKFDRNHSHYAYCEGLHEIIVSLVSEADQYLNGKAAPDNQLGLFESGEPEVMEEKPKKKRGKKNVEMTITEGGEE